MRHRTSGSQGRHRPCHTLTAPVAPQVLADARITKVRANGLIVFVPKYGIEGPVYLVEKGDEAAKAQWALDEETQMVAHRDGSRRYKIFDQVTVHIQVEQLQANRQRLLLALRDGEEPEELAAV